MKENLLLFGRIGKRLTSQRTLTTQDLQKFDDIAEFLVKQRRI
jgi:hypothetical protein